MSGGDAAEGTDGGDSAEGGGNDDDQMSAAALKIQTRQRGVRDRKRVEADKNEGTLPGQQRVEEGEQGGGEEVLGEVIPAEEIMPAEEIVMPSKPVDENRDMVKKMLDGCLKHGLAALCKEKPEEPVKWLADWLLMNNPNQPRVQIPGKALPQRPPTTDKPGKRTGSVLSPDCVLVPDPVERSENEHVVYPMPGAPGFVHCTAERASLVSQCSEEGVGHVLEAMQHGSSTPPSSVVWISLRNELVTYIAGKPYALRDTAAPLQPKEVQHAVGEQLQHTERDLKSNVEEEVSKECGRLALQGPGGVKAAWASVALGSIHTPAEVVEEAAKRAFGVVTAVDHTRFECLPLPSHRALTRQHILSLLELLQSLRASDAVVVSSEKGAPVSTMVAIAASMAQRVRASNGKRPLDLISREPLPISRKWNAPRGLLEEPAFAPVNELTQALDGIYDVVDDTAGSDRLGELAKLLCDDTVDRWQKPLHLRNRVIDLEQAAQIAGETAGAPGPKTRTLNEALVQYLIMVTFAALLLAPIGVDKTGAECVAEHQTAVLNVFDTVTRPLITE